MPPTWSNGQVMTNTECSVVKKWILKRRGRRYSTLGANVPLRRELLLTQGRNKLALFVVPVDVEDEQNTLNLCTDEVHSGKELPFNLLELIQGGNYKLIMCTLNLCTIFLELILVKTL